tara:strand:+ start:947 stop:1186 length:240 start_codon:yes stop_codon:yes gene_type:complete
MPTSGPEGSIDKVLQPDGSYKWEVVPHPTAESLDAPVKKAPAKPKVKKPLEGLTTKQKKDVTAPSSYKPPTPFNNDAAE